MKRLENTIKDKIEFQARISSVIPTRSLTEEEMKQVLLNPKLDLKLNPEPSTLNPTADRGGPRRHSALNLNPKLNPQPSGADTGGPRRHSALNLNPKLNPRPSGADRGGPRRHSAPLCTAASHSARFFILFYFLDLDDIQLVETRSRPNFINSV